MPRRMSLVVALAVAAHLVSSARAEAAAPLRAVAETIDVASTECISREALASKTAVSLQREEIDARLSMSVAMRGRDAFFQLSRSGAVVGERLVPRRNLTCEEFLSVLAVALAVAIDTALLADGSSDDGSSEKEAAPTRAEPPRPAPASASARASAAEAPAPPVVPPEPEPRLWLLALALEPAIVAALHEPTIGGGLGLVVTRRAVGRLGVSAFVTLPVDTDLGGRRARVGLIAARVDACLAPPFRNLSLAPCVATIVGAHRAEGVQPGSSLSAADSALWAALAFGPELTLAFGRWTLLARVEPWWVIRPSRLVTGGTEGELSKTGPHFGAAAFFGVRWTID